MPTVTTVSEALVELATLTGMTVAEWRDIVSLPPPAQALCVQAYRDADWRRDPDTFGQVLAVLGVIATIAGAVGGVAGAVSAIAALKALG